MTASKYVLLDASMWKKKRDVSEFGDGVTQKKNIKEKSLGEMGWWRGDV